MPIVGRPCFSDETHQPHDERQDVEQALPLDAQELLLDLECREH